MKIWGTKSTLHILMEHLISMVFLKTKVNQLLDDQKKCRKQAFRVIIYTLELLVLILILSWAFKLLKIPSYTATKRRTSKDILSILKISCYKYLHKYITDT